MKLHYIKNERELKGGQWYIRAVINCYGTFWLEKVKVNGRPRNSDLVICGKVSRKISTPNYYCSNESFINDLWVGRRRPYRSIFIRYSCKVWNKLSQIKDLRTFAETLYGQGISEKEHERQKEHYEFQEYMDDELSKMYVDDYDVGYDYPNE